MTEIEKNDREVYNMKTAVDEPAYGPNQKTRLEQKKLWTVSHKKKKTPRKVRALIESQAAVQCFVLQN